MLEDYLQKLNEVELLSSEKEEQLWYQFKEGDDLKARGEIIEAYQPLVFKIVKKYSGNQQLIMDLIQEGTVGLITAVDNYDPDRGVKFSTFAYYHIQGRIKDFLQQGVSRNCISLDEKSLLERLDLGDELIEQLVEKRLLEDKVKNIMDKLPLLEKEVIKGFYLKGLEASTLAENMEISLSYFYRLRKKALQRIRGYLSRLADDYC